MQTCRIHNLNTHCAVANDYGHSKYSDVIARTLGLACRCRRVPAVCWRVRQLKCRLQTALFILQTCRFQATL